MTNFIELLVLVIAVVDFLQPVEESLVIRVEAEDDSNFDELDEDDEAARIELECIESELVDFLLFREVTVVIRVEEEEDDSNFDEVDAVIELDVVESEGGIELHCE